MNPEVVKLIEKLKIKHIQKKITYERNFVGKLLPFYTRNPERAKYSEGFKGVLGVVAKDSLDKQNEFMIDYDEYKKNISNKLIVNEDLDKDKLIQKLFNIDSLIAINHPYVLSFQPLINSDREKKGEIEVGVFINKLFDLRNSEKWIKFISSKKIKNVVEGIVIDTLPIIPEKKGTSRNFIFFNENYYRKLMKQDLELLLDYQDFCIKYIDLFLGYYYFFYVTQTIIKIGKKKDNNEIIPMYYALDTEKVSGTRESIRNGFNKIKEENKYLLVNNDLLDYLNMLINTEKYYLISEILDPMFIYKEKLTLNLAQFLEEYQFIKDKNDNNDFKNNDLASNVSLLSKWLLEDLSAETRSRFPLSVEEIGKLYFLRNRGRLGNVLNATEELVLLFTGLIVGEKPKLLKDVFKGFELRGMFFDRLTKGEIINMYERMNLLDKKSDSGDAQYVKPIL
ncbi:DNA phosphorothioation-dependent restriction protein DptG [Carnobacterium sp. TMP28]|uniref:DNA phosphorothioation-dependent restriction protein DptG n=1 Tax=Carnobacterium sp. TMP28 TaxID=3397060 RepID=UPI0039E1A0D5